MYLRYIAKYRRASISQSSSPICASLAHPTDSELQHYSPYSKSIWYRYTGMPQKNLYYISPSGDRGEIAAEYRLGKSAGIEIIFKATNTWFKPGIDPSEYDPGDHTVHVYSAPSIEEVRLVLDKLKAPVEYIDRVADEYKQFIISSDKKGSRGNAIPKKKLSHSYFSILFDFYTDDFLRLNMNEKFSITCPFTGNIISNYPFDHGYRHPDSYSDDTKIQNRLLGKIASVALPNLDELLKDKFTHDKVNNETVFIVNNPNESGICVYPSQFYMPAITFIDDNSISKYKRIATVVVPGLNNGVYTTLIASSGQGHDCTIESAKWTCFSIEDAINRKIIFYTENDVIEHVDLRIKDRLISKEEVESKLRKLEVEDKIAQSKVHETAIKSVNNNLILVTGAVTAICTLVLTLIKAGVFSSTAGLVSIGFIPKLMCAAGIVYCCRNLLSSIGGWVSNKLDMLTSWFL